MKLKTEIIERIKGRDDIKNELIEALGCSRMSLWNWLNKNDENGKLTTVEAVIIISNALKVDVVNLFNHE